MERRVKLPAAIKGKRIQCNLSKAEAAHIASEQEDQEEEGGVGGGKFFMEQNTKDSFLINLRKYFHLTNY